MATEIMNNAKSLELMSKSLADVIRHHVLEKLSSVDNEDDLDYIVRSCTGVVSMIDRIKTQAQRLELEVRMKKMETLRRGG